MQQAVANCVESPGADLAQARLAGVLRAASSASIISTDLDGTILVFNSGAEKILGYRAEELLGRETPALFHDAAEVAARCRELSEVLGRPVQGFEAFVALVREGGPGSAEEREWTYVRKDGGRVPVSLSVTGVYSEAGELEGFLGVGLDLTERNALMTSLRQAQVSVDTAGDMVFWARVDDGRVVFANKAARDTLGYTAEEALKLTVLDLNPSRTLENWAEYCRRLREAGRMTYETAFRRKDGSALPVEVTSSLAEHGGVAFSVGIIRDITQRKALESQLRQAQVGMDNVQDMIIWTRTSDRRVVYANRAACETLGYGLEEFLSLEAWQINPARSESGWRESCDMLRQIGQMRFEAVYRRKDGSALPVETNVSIIVHEGVEYAVGIVRDITQRKEAEARLGAEMRLNQSLAEAARALIGAAPDMNAIASLLLDRACELTGSRYGYVAFIDQDSGGMQPQAMRAMMKNGQCDMGALPVTFPLGPDGRYPGLWGHSLNTRQGFFANDPALHPSACGLPDGHVAVTRVLSVPAVAKGRLVGQITLANPGRDYTPADLATVESLADVFALGTEQALAQRALLAAKDAAETSSRAKSNFLANMTHEVRTPLNGMLGMLQVLQGGGLSAEQREYVDVALASAERLHLLLNNVIEYARLDSTQEQAEGLSFPPTDLLRSLAALFEPRARERGLAFSVTAEPGLPELMCADPQALNQALAHLLDNALKFTPAGSVRLTAGPDPERPGRLAFCVSDTGIGIPPDQRDRVFEAFAQADASITRTYGGAGLGLAIARKLAQRMGGSLTAADRPGGGTVMSLTLPADCASDIPG